MFFCQLSGRGAGFGSGECIKYSREIIVKCQDKQRKTNGVHEIMNKLCNISFSFSGGHKAQEKAPPAAS